jgi:hypothetical protein
MAVASFVVRPPFLVRVYAAAEALSASGGVCGPLGVPCVAKPWPDELDALIGHVRICARRGWVTARADPADSVGKREGCTVTQRP